MRRLAFDRRLHRRADGEFGLVGWYSGAVPYARAMSRQVVPSAQQGHPQERAFMSEELLGPLNPLELLHAPKHLFVAGHAEWLSERPRVSIVGSRDASPEGIKRAARLARLLTENRVLVVSGLAEGIDRAAHVATIDVAGRTIAVIGTPLSSVYPARHRADVLIERMASDLPSSFRDLFADESQLVPVPGAGLTRPRTVWPALTLCQALQQSGLGTSVKPVLRRVHAVPKSAGSQTVLSW